MSCLKFLTLHFSADNAVCAAPPLFTPPSVTINQEIIYGAILIWVYLPYYDASSMTGSGQGHWVASSKSTAEATLLVPVFYHGTPQGLSVRLPCFRCVHPSECSQSFLTTSLQPTLPEDQTSPHASLKSQTLVGLSEPSGSGWLQLLGCVRWAAQPPPSIQSTSRDTIKNPSQMRRSLHARYGLFRLITRRKEQ